MSGRDRETRERLLHAAEQLFADRGFKRVTVREICRRARANVAAVNYHFGNKLGLYRQVVQVAIDALRGLTDEAKRVGAHCPPDERLRRFIHVSVKPLRTASRDDWIRRLIDRELTDPTPAIDALVEQAMRPRMEYLLEMMAELVGCAPSDPRAVRSLVSLQAQLTAYYRPHPIAERLGLRAKLTPDEVDQVADHIAEFSLAGIKAVGRA